MPRRIPAEVAVKPAPPMLMPPDIVQENVDHVIAAIEGLRLAVNTAVTDPHRVNWSALIGLIDIAEASCSPLLQLAWDMRAAAEKQSANRAIAVGFRAAPESDFASHLRAMRGAPAKE